MTQNKQSEPSTPATPPTPLCREQDVEDGGLGAAGGRLEVCLLLSRHCGGVWRGQWTGPGSGGGPADVLNTTSTRPPPPAFCPVGLSNNTDYKQPTGQSDNF